MMLSLAEMYRPITSTPFSKYEIEIDPCPVLKPYVRCFWGTACPEEAVLSEKLIIPDTCMDIIFRVDHAENRSNGVFCALDDRSYRTVPSARNVVVSVFGIRFYAWTAALFTEDTLKGSKNGRYPAEAFFSKIKSELEPAVTAEHNIFDRKKAAERVLLKHMRAAEADSGLLNAVYGMLKSCGGAKIADIREYACVSERKLERLFEDAMGLSPKAFSSLLRYQLLWQEMVSSRGFNVLDAVEKYGYTDQSHLLNDFKKRHLMYPKEAVELAAKNR